MVDHAVQAGGPVVGDLVPIDLVARRLAYERREARVRRHRLHRIAVGEHDARVGIGREQVLEAPHVRAGLAAPSGRAGCATGGAGAGGGGTRRPGPSRPRCRPSPRTPAPGTGCGTGACTSPRPSSSRTPARARRPSGAWRWNLRSRSVSVSGDGRSAAACAMRGSVWKVAASGGGDGNIVSHVIGARLSGSWARMSWRIVVPVRGKPMMNTGRTIRSVGDRRVPLAVVHVVQAVHRVEQRRVRRQSPHRPR